MVRIIRIQDAGISRDLYQDSEIDGVAYSECDEYTLPQPHVRLEYITLSEPASTKAVTVGKPCKERRLW